MTSVCLWELSDCTTTPSSYVGIMYADCAGTVCTCSNNACSSTTPPSIVPGAPVAVDDEFVAFLDNTSSTYQYASIVGTALPGRQKTIRSNKHPIPFAIPDKANMIPANPGDIMTGWGKNFWRVKYLKSLQLKDGGNSQFFALYKVYEAKAGNLNGEIDIPGDIYIGIRTTDPGNPANVPGGLSIISVSSNLVKKLEANQNGVVREVAAQVPVRQKGQSGANGNPLKWFHLYGAEY